jgi:hypothetical protein
LAELSAPKSLADDGNRVASRHGVFIGAEESSCQRLQAEDRKIVARYVRAGDSLDSAAQAQIEHVRTRLREQTFEYIVAITVIGVVWIRKRLIGVRPGVRHRDDEAENDGDGGNAEPHR